MSIQLDRDYATRLAPLVRNFIRTSNGYRFSCPVCGDSATKKSRARGHLYNNLHGLNYKCHKCDANFPRLGDLLVHIDNRLAEQYRVDSFLEFKEAQPDRKTAVKKPSFANQIDSELVKVSSLPDFHMAKKYVKDRHIPPDKHYLLYYTRTFKEFANRIDPSSFQHFNPLYHDDEPRLIIPLITAGQKISGYQGRSLEDSEFAKYMTILPHPDNNRMFGLDRVDVNKKVRVFEGPIDAFFIENSVATCGGRLDTALPEAGIDRSRSVVIYDNEPRKPETIKKIQKAISNKFPVCIWPQGIKETDVNAMVLAGRSPQEVQNIIDARTFSGLQADLEFAAWRKI